MHFFHSIDHVKKAHVKAKQYKCTQCSSSFSTKGNLNGNYLYSKFKIHFNYLSLKNDRIKLILPIPFLLY